MAKKHRDVKDFNSLVEFLSEDEKKYLIDRKFLFFLKKHEDFYLKIEKKYELEVVEQLTPEDLKTGVTLKSKNEEILKLNQTIIRQQDELLRDCFAKLKKEIKDIQEETIKVSKKKDQLDKVNIPDKRIFPSNIVFESGKERIYTNAEIEYLDMYSCLNKQIIQDLSKSEPNGKEVEQTNNIYSQFLRFTTFLCAVYGYYMDLIEDGNKIIIEINKIDAECKDDDFKEYYKSCNQKFYLFYNRSFIKGDIGIGEVEIINDFKVKVTYHYNKAKPLTTEGRIEKYNYSKRQDEKKGDIIIFKNLIDSENCHDDHKKRGPVESIFILKKYGKKTEKNSGLKDELLNHFGYENILLGITTSSNRENRFPYSTALILIDKVLFDDKYPNKFEELKRVRNAENLPPQVYYYLFHQEISLQRHLEKQNDGTKYKEQIAFNEISDLPFAKNESDNLSKIAGIYKGISFLKKRVGKDKMDYIVISKLSIHNHGEVTFQIDEKEETNKTLDNNEKGFVKYIKYPTQYPTNGKIFISLRYNYDEQINTFNLYLEIELKETESKEIQIYLKGCFAGESSQTHLPIASKIFFSKEKQENIKPKLFLLKDQNGVIAKEVGEEFKKENIKNFFLSSDYNEYTNIDAMNWLRDYYDLKPQNDITISNQQSTTTHNKEESFLYDVFISIPLTHTNNEKEYNRNCSLISKLCEKLIMWGYDKSKIFYACQGENEGQDFQIFEFYSRKQGADNYLRTKEALDKSKNIIFIYPKIDTKNIKKYRISSSLAEICYGVSKNAGYILLTDNEERKYLPSNILSLGSKREIKFDTTKDNDFSINLDANKDLIQKYIIKP